MNPMALEKMHNQLANKKCNKKPHQHNAVAGIKSERMRQRERNTAAAALKTIFDCVGRFEAVYTVFIMLVVNDTLVRVIHQKCQSIWSIACTPYIEQCKPQAVTVLEPNFLLQNPQQPNPTHTIVRRFDISWRSPAPPQPTKPHRSRHKFVHTWAEHVANINYAYYVRRFDSSQQPKNGAFFTFTVFQSVSYHQENHKFVHDNDSGGRKYAWEMW